ncbi:glutaminyl-tRNA synthase (glutamine-hydrolyzing) subunit A [Alkalihalophilus pseudofirmus]|nr:glutaminyl-tRNA synthase (glutamine-hydrolyzing) subunit A [Alkalihalophilus pseudofirmus]
MSELAKKTIAELAPLVESKELSPVEITEAVIKRTKEYNPTINAYIDINEETALEAAKAAETEISNGNYKGVLHGIPLALKDILNFKGETVTYGSKIHKDFVPDFDATVVAKLKEAGSVFTGKLNMHEYAWGATTDNPHFGACRNPWDLQRNPMGSSGGSGAAVAADMTIASLGTDTGGSIRMPAAACGIIGLKPTHGRVSKYGCFPLSWSLDHIGPMTKTVEDAAILLEYIAGYDEKDPTTIEKPIEAYSNYLTGDIKGKVIGIIEDYFFQDIDNGIEKTVRDGIKQLESMGATVEVIKVRSLKYAMYAEYITILAESSTIHARNIQTRPNDFGEDVRLNLKLGMVPSGVDYLQAQQIRRMIDMEFLKAFEKVDVIIGPSLPVAPPTIGIDTTSQGVRLSCPANLTGLPSISVPCGISEGLPVGMQIIGPAFKEAEILNFAYALEKTNPLNGIRPSFEEELNKSVI